ncbi:MAG TPA: exodeoxyribonuclease VII large subunit [Tepidisphaeraceae bacterium]|nr:exodeoxyribonuclease VII large subunit [Tepidisphaeraceae bacterium]
MTADFFQFRQQMQAPRRAAPPPQAVTPQAMTVSEITEKIRRVIAGGMPDRVLVRGEVSNLNRHKPSGHIYFTLKDDSSCLPCVMFQREAAGLKFQLQDGQELLASGRVGVYPARGVYQLYVNTLSPVGQGALELAFRQMKAKLEAEGLFATDRKKPVPAYPRRIVLITSAHGAALHDVLKVLKRFAWLWIGLYPVPVQGDGAGDRIANAIAHVNRSIASTGGADVILLVRGGGSLEDLWSFNEEIVARAIADSRIPIVSGIGHEVDVSIADLVADHHAHTPTEAAQVITAQWRGAEDLTRGLSQRLRRSLRVVVDSSRQRLEMLARHETFRRPTDRLNQLRQLLDDRERTMIVAQERLLREGRTRLTEAQSRIDLLFSQHLRVAHDRLTRLATLLQECHPRLRFELSRQRLEVSRQRLERAASQGLQLRGAALDAMARQLDAVSPQSVLRRGYSITSRRKDRIPLRSASQLKPGDRLVTRFADGQVESTVDDSQQLSLFE